MKFIRIFIFLFFIIFYLYYFLEFDFNQLLKYILDFHDEIENASNAFFRSSNLIIYRQNRHIDQMDLLPKEFYFGDPVSHYFAKAWIIDNNTTNAKLNKVNEYLLLLLH